MAKKEVVSYVKGMLSKKYPMLYIRQKLKDTGYTDDEINDSIDSAKHPEKHKLKFLFPLIGILILSAGALFFLLPKSEKQEQDFSFKIKAPDSAALSSTIHLQREIISSGKSSIFIRYELISKETGEIIYLNSEKLAPPNIKKIEEIQILIKDIETGGYILRATAEFPGGKKIITEDIEIVKHTATTLMGETTTTSLPSKITTTTLPVTTTLPQKPADSEFPIEEYSQIEVLQEIRELAEKDESAALNRCNELKKNINKDSCYSYVAEASKNKQHCSKINDGVIKDECFEAVSKVTKDDTICEDIKSEKIKDSCYITFFLDFADYSVCHRINDGEIRSICETLRDAG